MGPKRIGLVLTATLFLFTLNAVAEESLDDAIEGEIDQLKLNSPNVEEETRDSVALPSPTKDNAPPPIPGSSPPPQIDAAEVPTADASPPELATSPVKPRRHIAKKTPKKSISPPSVNKINALKQFDGTAPVFREDVSRDLGRSQALKNGSLDVDELVPRPELPPRKASLSPLKNLPPSFQYPVSHAATKKYDVTGLDVGPVRSMTTPATVFVHSYLLDRTPSSVGQIEEIEIGDEVASLGQYLIVRLTRSAQPGQRFSVIRKSGSITDAKRGELGPVIEVGGRIEIREPVSETKNTYRAIVILALNPIRSGSLVSEEDLPKISYARRGTLLNVQVRVLGGESGTGRKIFGEGAALYLDGGSEAGLTTGDLLPVQARREGRRSNTLFPDLRRSIGLLKLVKVEPTVATAVVMEAKEEIMADDRTGGPLSDIAPPISIAPEL